MVAIKLEKKGQISLFCALLSGNIIHKSKRIMFYFDDKKELYVYLHLSVSIAICFTNFLYWIVYIAFDE